MKKEKIAAIALCGTMGLSVCLSGLPARAVSEAFAEEMPAEGAVSETITLSENPWPPRLRSLSARRYLLSF